MSGDPRYRLKNDSSKRDILIALLVGAGLVVFLVTAIVVSFERAGSRGVHGSIIEKIFVVEPSTEISVGAGGLKKKVIEGEYSFKVRDEIKGTIYTLSVPKEVFDRYNEGDEYFFAK